MEINEAKYLFYCSNCGTFDQIIDTGKVMYCKNRCGSVVKNTDGRIKVIGASSYLIELDATEFLAGILDCAYDRDNAVRRTAGYPISATIVAPRNRILQ